MNYEQRIPNLKHYWDTEGFAHTKEEWLEIDTGAEFTEYPPSPQIGGE